MLSTSIQEVSLNKFSYTSDILQSQDRCVLVLVLLDLSATFDNLDHCILLHRLENCFSISGKPLSWMTSYLTDRYQTVCFDVELFESVLMECSETQGTVLGTKNYVMYTKPLGDVIITLGLCHHVYAEETQLYLASKPKR